MVIPLVFNPGPTATTSERIVGLDRVPSGTHQQTSARVGPVAIASRELSSESECDRHGRHRGPGPVHRPDRRVPQKFGGSIGRGTCHLSLTVRRRSAPVVTTDG